MVEFSRIDLESHERGYPALLDIGRGVPVGALVYGQRSIAADIWLPDGSRRTLESYRVIGHEITRLYAQPRREGESDTEHDRQVRMFGAAGQHILRASKVAVIGLGEVGSLVTEYLARLGVGNLVLIDPDEIESTNLSRVVGATPASTSKRGSLRPRSLFAMRARWRLMPCWCRSPGMSREIRSQKSCAIATSSSWLPTPCEPGLSSMRLATSTSFLRYRWARKYGAARAANSRMLCVRCGISGLALDACGATA